MFFVQLIETQVMLYPFQVFPCELFVESERFEVLQWSVLAAVFHQYLGLIEIEVGMVAQAVYAGMVDGDASDGGGVDAKPIGQLSVVEVDFFQLVDTIEAAQSLAVSADEACDAASDAGYFFQFGSVGTIQFDQGAGKIFLELCLLKAVIALFSQEEGRVSGDRVRFRNADIGEQDGILLFRQAVYFSEVLRLAEDASLFAIA